MNTPLLLSPDTLIQDSLERLAGASYCLLAIPTPTPEKHPPAEALHSVVYHRDLTRMVEMGLGHLPACAISYQTPLNPALLTLFEQPDQIQPTCYNVTRQLSELFPRRFVVALYELQSLFRRQSLKGYLIGGIARDLLRADSQLSVQDIDITVEGDAMAVARWIAESSSNFELAQVYPEFGTAKLVYKQWMTLDLASTRQEVYRYSGALPDITDRGVPLVVDLRRRDFTMNSLALAIHDLGEVVDYTGGALDGQLGQIRVLHGASFFEDPTRILRAYKFASRFNCEIEPNTLYLIQQFLLYADAAQYKAGGTRIRQVLESWFNLDETPAKRRWLEHWLEAGGWRLIMPNADYCPTYLTTQGLLNLKTFWQQWPQVEDTIRHLREEDEEEDWPTTHNRVIATTRASDVSLWLLYLCLLLRGLCQPDALALTEHRLALSRTERDVVTHFIRLGTSLELEELETSPDAMTLIDALEPHPTAALLAQMALSPHSKRLLALLLRYEKYYAGVKAELRGDDLITLGVQPNKGLGQLLRTLRQKRLSGELESRQDEIEFVQNYLKHLPKH